MNRLNTVWASLALIFVLACGAQDQGTEVAEDPLAEGKQHLEEGEFSEAQAFFEEKLAASAPEEDPELHFWAGQAAAMAANFDQAEAHLLKSVELDPEAPAYYDWLGRVYGAQARNAPMIARVAFAPKIQENFEKALELNPENLEAKFFLGTFYIVAPPRLGGDKEKGKAIADELLTADPLAGHRLMAQYYASNKEDEKAVAEYEEAIALASDDPQSYSDLGSFYLNREQIELAVENFEKALEIDPEHQAALEGLGGVGARSEEHIDQGIESLKKLKTLERNIQSPNMTNAQYRLASLYEDKGLKEEALAAYEEAEELGHMGAPVKIRDLRAELGLAGEGAEAGDEATTPAEATAPPETAEADSDESSPLADLVEEAAAESEEADAGADDGETPAAAEE